MAGGARYLVAPSLRGNTLMPAIAGSLGDLIPLVESVEGALTASTNQLCWLRSIVTEAGLATALMLVSDALVVLRVQLLAGGHHYCGPLIACFLGI